MTDNKLPQVNTSLPSEPNTLNMYLAQMDAGLKFASMLIKSGTIPERWKNQESVFATILRGSDYGFTPIQSLEVFYMVHGKLGMDSHGIGAVIQSHGGTIETIEDTATAQTVRITRPGHPSVEYRFTIEDAGKAKLLTNAKYQELPRNMLYARALTFGARKLYADKLRGMKTKEELEDTKEDDGKEAAESVAALLTTPDVQVLPAEEKPAPEAPKSAKVTPKTPAERIGKLIDTIIESDGVGMDFVEKWIAKFAGGRTPETMTHDDFRLLYKAHQDLCAGVAPESFFEDAQ